MLDPLTATYQSAAYGPAMAGGGAPGGKRFMNWKEPAEYSAEVLTQGIPRYIFRGLEGQVRNGVGRRSIFRGLEGQVRNGVGRRRVT